MQDIELGLGCSFEFRKCAVSRPLSDDAQAHLFKKNSGGPCVSADVVVANNGHVVGRSLKTRRLAGLLVENPVAKRVVGDVVSKRLRNAAKALAPNRDDRLAVLLGLGAGNSFDVVADQPNRALGLDRDSLVEREQRLNLIDDLGQLLIAAKDNILLLKIRGELQRNE